MSAGMQGQGGRGARDPQRSPQPDGEDAIELLVRQHREIESRMQRVVESLKSGAAQAQVSECFARVGDHLTVHLASEEQVFYPAVKAGRTEDILLESLEEHLSLKRLLADLLELDPQAQTFEPKFKVLKEQCEHHHEEEEEHLFPKVRECLGAQRLQTLAREMLALQQRLQREGAPREAVAEQTDEAAPLA